MDAHAHYAVVGAYAAVPVAEPVCMLAAAVVSVVAAAAIMMIVPVQQLPA